MKELATELGHTPAQVALACNLHSPGVTVPIIGARTLAQLEERSPPAT
ncbi:aldo/keto reductase [Streptomyces sp. NPDC023327]